MRARSRYWKIGEEKIVDRRGAERTIKLCGGTNKGKTYPYRSKKRDGQRPQDTA